MTTKRTHGPCTCYRAQCSTPNGAHSPDCPSLSRAQQEPDALKRLMRLIRMGPESGSIAHRDVFAVKALALIFEAREEQRKRDVLARSDGLGRAAGIAHDVARKANGYPERQKAALDIATLILEAKESEP